MSSDGINSPTPCGCRVHTTGQKFQFKIQNFIAIFEFRINNAFKGVQRSLVSVTKFLAVDL